MTIFVSRIVIRKSSSQAGIGAQGEHPIIVRRTCLYVTCMLLGALLSYAYVSHSVELAAR
jgi:hypothetical protein